MGSALPRARRRDGSNAGLLVLLLAFVALLVGVIVVLLSNGTMFDRSPQSDLERDYQFLLAAAKKTPEDPAVLMTLAETEMQLGKSQDAFDHADLALKFGSKKAAYNQRYATLLGLDRRAEAAIPYLKKEIELDGKGRNPEPHFLLAQIASKSGEHKEALKEIRLALKIDPMAADVRLVYAEILENAGEKKDAVKQYKVAMKFLPGDERPVSALERLGVKVDSAEASAPAGHP
ncbi:MAG: tetratricopeptide repeat protein [Coriobacteriales bacterium]|nr:tetratricopeptide repeat protein [Coriobacteriales bacterium]